jgi:hypothetical protein
MYIIILIVLHVRLVYYNYIFIYHIVILVNKIYYTPILDYVTMYVVM